jgi:hypothetical protein
VLFWDQYLEEVRNMANRRRYSPEKIITKICEAEVYLGQGKTVGQAGKALAISENNYCCWHRNVGGMDVTPGQVV